MLGLLIKSARIDVKRELQKPKYLRVHLMVGGGLWYVGVTVEA